MPPHDHHYNDKYWDDMPEAAHKAAAILGYTKESWDADSPVPYDSKSFFECTSAEKQAAMFLNLGLIKKKLNVWWGDLDQATKDQATVLGWSQEKWDDDWELEHLPVDKLYWADLDTKQRTAANHFGYIKASWDETFDEFSSSGSAAPAVAAASAASATPVETTASPEKKTFTPPPKGKVFQPVAKKEDHKEEKKEEHHDDEHKFIKPFKKLFGKLRD